MKWTLAMAAAALTTACAWHEGKTEAMDSWMGASIDDVIAVWGYPTGEREVAGRKLYTWGSAWTQSLPTTTQASVSGSAATASTTPSAVDWSCTLTLEVDDAERVVSWQAEGNDCRPQRNPATAASAP